MCVTFSIVLPILWTRNLTSVHQQKELARCGKLRIRFDIFSQDATLSWLFTLEKFCAQTGPPFQNASSQKIFFCWQPNRIVVMDEE